MLSYCLPNHTDSSSFTAEPKAKYQRIQVTPRLSRTGLDCRLDVRVEANGTNTSDVFDIFYEFKAANPHPNLVCLLAALSANWAGMHCVYSADMLSFKETVGASHETVEHITRFWMDFVWQNRVGNLWRRVATAESPRPKVEFEEYLPEAPYRSFTVEPDQDLIQQETISFGKLADLANDCVLGLSFGKESLLSLAWLKDGHPDLGLVEYADNHLIRYEKLQQYAGIYPDLLEKIQIEQQLGCKTAKVRTNFYQQFNREVQWDVINYFQQIYTVLLALASSKTYIVLGDEYDCYIEDALIIDGQSSKVFTLDYHQSNLAHAKMNRLFKLLDVPKRVTSLLTNLNEFQIQGLLAKMAPELLNYQASCWFSSNAKFWCNSCSKCSRISLMFDALKLPMPSGLKPPAEQAVVADGPSLFAVDVTANCQSPLRQISGDLARRLMANTESPVEIIRGTVLASPIVDAEHPMRIPSDLLPKIQSALDQL